ncbi:MAG: DUF4389 domain-containing protein [Brevinematales bacterium]|nr:DUF4389 domain-containing protein [Brevinematales bacterium]
MAYPVTVSGACPPKVSRLLLLARTFFGFIYVMIPHGFCLMFRGIATAFLGFLAFWVVLFTGKYPQKFFDFNVGTQRWGISVMSYMMFLTDVYPPFTGKESGYPITLNVEYPEKLSRLMLLVRTFFGIFYVMIPHGFILYFRMIAVMVISFISFWAILFTGKFPEKMFGFILGTLRWVTRMGAYMSFMTDVYPPFTGKEV